MSTHHDDPFAHPASALALAVFRLNGALLAAGDDLTAAFGLTSARWQVMGAVAASRGGDTVSGIARAMGLTRQSVQRVVNDLAGTGLVVLADNPGHRRAPLVQLTADGESRFRAATDAWTPLADRLVAGLSDAALADATRLLHVLKSRLAEPENLLLKSRPSEPEIGGPS